MRPNSTAAQARVPLRRAALILLSSLLAGSTTAPAASLEGEFAASWGDPAPWTIEPAAIEYSITDDVGAVHLLEIPAELLEGAGGLVTLNRRRVGVDLEETRGAENGAARVLAIQATRGSDTASRVVNGTSAWITLPCKFADKTAEQRDVDFFEQMYGNSNGRLDHYWREVSFDAVTIDGQAIDWIELPYPQSHYISTPGSGTSSDKTALFNDCVGAADGIVDFSNSGNAYDGINMMFNDVLDCCAWGGNRHASLDGTTKSWRVTWNPPWAFTNETVIAHEMGHGFGLPHSNNSDGDSNPYDNPWDVLSDAWSHATSDATYGTLGKHVNGYHKQVLGWIPAGRQLDIQNDGFYQILIDDLAFAGTPNLQLVTIAIDGTRYYTVEARDFTSYDSRLPGNAIILHEVVPYRSEPAWVLDESVPPSDSANTEGVMWRVGERFEDLANEITIEVLSETARGFSITIQKGANGNALFRDGFESGAPTSWDDVAP